MIARALWWTLRARVCAASVPHTRRARLPAARAAPPAPQVDVLLVTHFHLDHCAAVPFLLAHTNFRGRVFMTHPTKAIYNMLLADFVKLNRGGGDDPLFTEADLMGAARRAARAFFGFSFGCAHLTHMSLCLRACAASLDRIEVVDFYQELDLGGIKVTPYRAGHVLGAAMFMVEIAGLRVLYTVRLRRSRGHICKQAGSISA